MFKSILKGWSFAKFKIVLSQSLLPFMNFSRYSTLYLALQFSALILTSSPENSDFAEFRFFASIMKLLFSMIKEQASATTAQSSTASIKSTEFISTLAPNSKFGISLSSLFTSIKFNVKFLLILSGISIFNLFSSLFRINELLIPTRLKIFFKSSKFTPQISCFAFPKSNCENAFFERKNLTIATFAGSIATTLIPELSILNLTSITRFEISSITLDSNKGFSSFICILF